MAVGHGQRDRRPSFVVDLGGFCAAGQQRLDLNGWQVRERTTAGAMSSVGRPCQRTAPQRTEATRLSSAASPSADSPCVWLCAFGLAPSAKSRSTAAASSLSGPAPHVEHSGAVVSRCRLVPLRRGRAATGPAGDDPHECGEAVVVGNVDVDLLAVDQRSGRIEVAAVDRLEEQRPGHLARAVALGVRRRVRVRWTGANGRNEARRVPGVSSARAQRPGGRCRTRTGRARRRRQRGCRSRRSGR